MFNFDSVGVCVYTNTSLGMYKTSLILVCTKHLQQEDVNNWRFISMDTPSEFQYKINSFKVHNPTYFYRNICVINPKTYMYYLLGPSLIVVSL